MRHGLRIATHFAISLKRPQLAPRLCRLCQLRRWQSTADSPLPKRRWSTPLAETIAKAIEVTGPISIASYMRQCLTNPDGGYYTTTRPTSDQFGRRGDFITSPEISQIFGELIGVWFLTEWMGQGRPATGVQFMEVGPGRGTMMNDILRTAAQFRSFAQAIEAVWLVEAGEGLREQQCKLLCGPDAKMGLVEENGKPCHWEAKSTYAGIPVKWVEDVALLPNNRETAQKTPFIIAHEFFDALPIHAFESIAAAPPEPNKTELLDKHGRPMVRANSASKIPQWRELLVAPTEFKFDLFATSKDSLEQKQPDTDFHLTIAKASNANSLVIPERPRYRKLKLQPQSRIEVSPESYRYIRDFAKRVGGNYSGQNPAGAALIIDYGPSNTIPVNSLRGIKEHKIVSPFTSAGRADISADVDFGALADAALEGSEGVEVHGPVEQGIWLSQLGIKDRAERLKKGVVDEEKRNEIEAGWKRLVESGPAGMGKAYKIMSILPENSGRRAPVGFGGQVS